MDRLKQIFALLFMTAMIGSVAVSCEDSGDNDSEDTGRLIISSEYTDLVFYGTQPYDNFEGASVILTAPEAWNVTPSEPWVVCTPDSGVAGLDKFTINVDDNDSDSNEERTAEVVVKSGSYTKVLKITQKRVNSIDVIRDELVVDGRSREFSVLVQSNVQDMEAVIPTDCDWVHYMTQSTNPNNELESTVVFSIDAQERDAADRVAEIKIWNSEKGVEDTFKLTQTLLPVIDLDKESTLDYNYGEQKFDVTVATNVEDVDVVYDPQFGDADDKWIQHTYDEQSATYSFVMTKNSGTEPRNVTIKFASAELDMSSDIELHQGVKEPFVEIADAADAAYNSVLPYVSAEYKICLKSNVTITPREDSEWLSIGENVEENIVDGGEMDDRLYTYTLNVLKNSDETGSNREAVVKFTIEGESTPISINIQQSEEQPFVAINADEREQYQKTNAPEEREFEVKVNSNEDIVASLSDEAWISQVSKTEGTEDADGVKEYIFKFKINSNISSSAVERNNVVTFTTQNSSGEAQSDKITITQSPKVSVIKIDPMQLAVYETSKSFLGDSFEVVVSSNVEVATPASQGGWFSVDYKSEQISSEEGYTQYTYVITVVENTNESAKSESILFESKNSSYVTTPVQLTISQDAMPRTQTIAMSAQGDFLTQAKALEDAGEVDLMSVKRLFVTGNIAMSNEDLNAIRGYFPNLTYINLEDTALTILPSKIFDGFATLEECVLPRGLIKIGEFVFRDTKLKTINFPLAFSQLGPYAFEGSAIESVVIPSGMTEIREFAFANCESLKSVTLEAGLKFIGANMFQNCINLESITIPSSVKTWSTTADGLSNAFFGCHGLKSITLEEGLTVIGARAFFNCDNFSEITIPSTLNTWNRGTNVVEAATFVDCQGLKYVYLSNGLKTISAGVFLSCGNIISITSYSATPPTITRLNKGDDNDLYLISKPASSKPIYVPAGCLYNYKSGGWDIYTNIIELE